MKDTKINSTIIQSDRQMAAEVLPDCNPGCGLIEQGLMRSGELDNAPLVQTIARARIAGWNAAVEAAAEICDRGAYTYSNAKHDAKMRKQRQEARDFESMGMACAFRAGDIRSLRLDQEGKDDE